MRRRTLFFVLCLVAVAILAMPALAVVPSRSSISLVVLQATQASAEPAAAPSFGARVTYTVTTADTANPWVETQCFQSRRLVYSQIHGFFAGYFTEPVYQLGPTPSWSGGSASCTATLFSYDGGRRKNLAKTTFTVAS